MPKLKTRAKPSGSAKILVVHGKSQNPTDIVATLKSAFKDVHVIPAPAPLPSPRSETDLIIVDYRVHDMAGILYYKELSQLAEFSLVPAIFISQTTSNDHRLNAYELGAADYLTRPLIPENFLEKCHLQLHQQRRILEDRSIHIGNLSLYPESKVVLIAGRRVPLTKYEYKILHFILSTPRHVVPRTEIYEGVWGPDHTASGRLDTQLYNLKKKLVDFNGRIKSVNKVGMRILLADSTFSQEPSKVGPQPPRPHQHL